MNKKIYACIIFSFVISFGLLLIVQNYFQEEPVPKGSGFYSQDFSSENELIFLIGSSNIGQLNTTLIHGKVSQKFPQYLVYNLAYNGDMPSERIKTVDEIIKLKELQINVCGKSMIYLLGTEIKWVENYMGKGLEFNNPNATSNCGCGETFNI